MSGANEILLKVMPSARIMPHTHYMQYLNSDQGRYDSLQTPELLDVFHMNKIQEQIGILTLNTGGTGRKEAEVFCVMVQSVFYGLTQYFLY